MDESHRTILVAVADTHSGGATGLPAPGTWQSENGQEIVKSKGQDVVWGQWEEAWSEIAKLRDKKTRIVIVHNGDAIDGNHPRSRQYVTTNLGEQERIHAASMDWALQKVRFNKKKGDKLFYIRGTESHVGCSEESVARDLTDPKTHEFIATPYIKPTVQNLYKDGQLTHFKLLLDINGKLFHFCHKFFSVGRRAWTKENPIFHSVKSEQLKHLQEGRRCPDVFVSSHFHKYAHSTYHGMANGQPQQVDGFVTPAFQTKTDYAYTVAPTELSDIGLLYFIIEKDGSWQSKLSLFQWEPERTIKL